MSSPTIIAEIDYHAPELRQAHHLDVAGVIAGTDADWLSFNPEQTPGGHQIDRVAIPRQQYPDLYRRIQALAFGITITERLRT